MTAPSFKIPTHVRSPLDIARTYIAAGVQVFPCHESTIEEFDPATGEFVERAEKSPFTPNGLKGASRSERIIGIWFGDRYPNAVIGVPTGEPLGAWVLDLDRHLNESGILIADGHGWMAEMEALHGPLPPTARANTAGNGTHIFFKHVEGLRNRADIAPGVDSRADGGYIVAPGSVMADGRRYEWIDADGVPCQHSGLPEFADAPEWLLELLRPKPVPIIEPGSYTHREGDSTVYVERAVRMEMESLASCRAGRNQAINVSAFALGTLVGAGLLTRADAESQIMAAANANGYVAKDGERAARQTMKSGLDSGVKSPRQIQERPANDNGTSVDYSALVRNERKKKAEQGKTAPAVASAPSAEPTSSSPEATQPRKRSRFELTWFDEIEEGKPKETIVKGVLGESEFTVLSGLPGTGKSVIVTDMACHIAAGMPWHGRRIKQGLVIYIAAERKKLTERRMMAFRKHHGVADVPLLVVGGRLDLTANLNDANAVVALIKEAETETGMPCVLAIVDTLTRTFGGGDQNTSKDMSRYVQSCDQILAETKAHVLVIHHTAWAGERMKGAIDLDGAVDATFLVKKDHGKYKLVCNGTNDGEEGDLLTFKMESVTLGHDEDGEPTTAPVVVPVAADVGRPVSGGPTGINAKVLAALAAAIAAEGQDPQGPAYPDGVMVVKEDVWRAAYYAASEGKDDTLRKRFGSGRKKLLEDGVVRMVGQWYWVA
ncbi:MAG: AAA family ATPase [Cypionkella sp.]